MEFLNCNYPNKLSIPPGKPKQLRKANFSMKLNGTTLTEEKKGTIWFNVKNYYWGVELELKYNRFGLISRAATVGDIDTALINWQGH